MQSVTFHLSQQARKGWLVLAAAAAVLLGVSWFLMPVRTWNSTLIATYAAVTVGLGGLVFIAFEYVTGAGWSVAFRRVSEALAMSLPVTGLVLVLLIAAGSRSYTWHPSDDLDAGTFWFKELWLARSWLVLRAAVYVILWSLLGWAVIAVSRRQDQTRALTETFTNRRLSACVLLVFAPTFTLAACDWFMSLEPMWFSTVWGAYHFAGLAMSTLATTVLFSLYLRRAGPLSGCFRDDHLHDLGKLLFGFSCFWMYLWFSQYMLIWYSNIPEETSYFVPRVKGSWGPLVIANLALNWFIPFFVLLPRAAKRSSVIMARISILVLFGRWLDLYLMVFPSTNAEGPQWGMHEVAWTLVARVPEMGAAVLAVCAVCLLFFQTLAKASVVPVGDPLLSESLHLGSHHTA